MNVRLVQTLNLSFGIALILALNAVGALPSIPHGVQHAVGPETVSVYPPGGEPHEILTPIGTFEPGTGFVDTGQRVQVYLVNSYLDDEIKFCPRWTFLIALCMVVIHLALNPWKPRLKTESPPQS